MSNGDNVIPLRPTDKIPPDAMMLLQEQLRNRDQIIARLHDEITRMVNIVGKTQFERGFASGLRAGALGMVIAAFAGFCFAMVVMP